MDQRIGGNPSQELALDRRELSRSGNRGRQRTRSENRGEAVHEWEGARREGRIDRHRVGHVIVVVSFGVAHRCEKITASRSCVRVGVISSWPPVVGTWGQEASLVAAKRTRRKVHTRSHGGVTKRCVAPSPHWCPWMCSEKRGCAVGRSK